MRGIFLFAVGASIVGIVFFVSLFELLFTVRRRKAHAALEAKIKELKTTYNESVNKLVIDGESKLEETEKQVEELSGQAESTKVQVTSEYEAKLAKLQEEADKEVAHAKARAKKLEAEAKLKAEEYLASRKDEVEHDLMDLVLSVTKKVLPESLEYTVQKELVLEALRDVKAEGPPHS
jgi:flagellar biosynthesis/type III secretory pathway protein FliH